MSTNASITALKEQINSGKLKSNRAYILNYIKDEAKIGTDLTQLLNVFLMKQSTITSQLSTLTELGLIYVDGERHVKKTLYSIYYFEPDEFKQADNRKRVKAKKFKRLIENALKQKEYFNFDTTVECLETELVWIDALIKN